MDTSWGRLRQERLRLGLSQEEFGKRGGVRKQAQIKYEQGKRQPDLNYLARIAVIGADVAYILTGDNPAHRATYDAIRAATAGVADARGTMEQHAATRDAYAMQRLLASPELDAIEAYLIADYRRCVPNDQDTISKLAARLANATEPQSPVTEAAPKKSARKRAKNEKGTSVRQVFHDKVDQVAGRDVVNRGKKR
jgi:transcriptional regulator with XRE-family HTH domain